jgi:hypothetical protein
LRNGLSARSTMSPISARSQYGEEIMRLIERMEPRDERLFLMRTVLRQSL